MASLDTLGSEHNRFQSPFIFKMSFYSPGAKNQAKNAAHISYIGKRTGVDLGNELEDGEKPVSEAMKDLDDKDPGTAAGHVKYAHERPGSHGLFGAAGEQPNLAAVQNELQEHKGVVWRSILSLKEEDAKLLDFDNRKSWETALRAAVPEAAAKMGIGESNLRWVAAFHQEKGHPHVHLVMWEKDPKRTKGRISEGERKDVKNVFMREIYAEERTRLTQEKTAMRDLIRDLSKGDTSKAVALVEDVRKELKNVELDLQATGAGKTSIAPKAYPDELKVIVKGMDDLSKLMPGRGRVALKFMPEEAKTKARQIAEQMMQQPDFKESLDRYMKSVHDMTRLHTTDPEKIERAKTKAYEDLRDRVANVVVRGASQINKDDRKKEWIEKKEQLRTKKEQQADLKDKVNTAKSVWKSAWRAMEQARTQTEAQGEIEKRRMAQRQKQAQRQQQNSQEHER
jgi:hypothetical protein